VAAQLAIGLIIYGGAVDFVGYWQHAMQFIDLVVIPGRFDLILNDQFIDQHFASRSVLLLSMMVTVLMLFVGPNIIAIFLIGLPVSAAAAFIFHRAYEDFAPTTASRRRFALMILLFPSVAFWSVFLGKDVWVFFFSALSTLMVSRLLHRFRVKTALALLASVLMTSLFRPHVGGMLLLAAVAVFALRPLRVRGPALYLKPLMQAAVTATLVMGFMSLAGSAVTSVGAKALTVDALAERAYLAHKGFATTEGGAALPIMIESNDPTSVATFIPFGIMTLWFRPFVWEAHNVMALVAGLENAVLLGLFVWRVPSLWRSLFTIRREPMVGFVWMVLITTSAVLAFDWNLGAMQRHRTMVLPFLFMLMALPRRRAELDESPA
jgi:hypothetical protein